MVRTGAKTHVIDECFCVGGTLGGVHHLPTFSQPQCGQHELRQSRLSQDHRRQVHSAEESALYVFVAQIPSDRLRRRNVRTADPSRNKRIRLI